MTIFHSRLMECISGESPRFEKVSPAKCNILDALQSSESLARLAGRGTCMPRVPRCDSIPWECSEVHASTLQWRGLSHQQTILQCNQFDRGPQKGEEGKGEAEIAAILCNVPRFASSLLLIDVFNVQCFSFFSEPESLFISFEFPRKLPLSKPKQSSIKRAICCRQPEAHSVASKQS